MNTPRGLIRLAAGIVVAGALGLTLRPVQAADRSSEFVDGLRKRQFYDTAFDYLESMRGSPLADKAFLDVIDFEIGVTLVESARLLPLVDREKRLNESRNAFQKFITEHPQHWLTIEASAHLGNLLVDRGRVKMELSTRFQKTPEQKKQLATEARALFQEAEQLFKIIDTDLTDKRKEYKNIDANDERRLEERTQLRTDTMQVQLAMASLVYEIAKTYDHDSKEYKETLQTAATKFDEYYKKYARWVGGFYARIDEARCYQDMGDYARAIGVLSEVMAKKDYDEGFHRVRSVATALSLQIALMPQVKQYKEALDTYMNWDQNIAYRHESTPEALAVKCLGGEAALEFARSLQVNSIESLKQRNELLQTARELLTFSANFPSEYRGRARVKLADPLLSGVKARVEAPRTYEEARDRARVAWDRLRQPDRKADELPQLRSEARQGFRFALMHAPRGTPVAEINDFRYYLAFLYWEAGEYYDAAVAAEFLARRFPNQPLAQQAAKLTLAAYLKLLNDGEEGTAGQFEKDRMIGIAQFITDRWPNSPAADEAWAILIDVAIHDRDLAKMVEYLGHVSPESPRRGGIEVRAGQELWTAYLKSSNLPEAKRPGKQKLADMAAQSRKALEDGVNRLRKPVEAGGKVSTTLAAAALSLAQVYLKAGEAQKAIDLLDDPDIGPHVLATENHKVAFIDNFRVEALKATLRAYVAAQALENVEETMLAIEKAEGKIDLTHLYFELSRQLDRSLRELQEKGHLEQAANVARALTLLLGHLADRPAEETTFEALRWTGKKFESLGKSIAADNKRLPPEAVDYYRKAAKTYGAIVKASKADEKFAPDADSVAAAQMQMAYCLRRIGEYGQSLTVLTELLRERNSLPPAQRDAAITYQAWGEQKPGAYRVAIRGGDFEKQEDGKVKQIVWGWGGIAKKVGAKMENNPAYRDLYYEARYNLAFCRFQYAMSKEGQDRTAQLNQTQRDIMIDYKLDPELGGKERYEQYDALLKKVQRLLGDREAGLKAFESAPAELSANGGK